MPSLQQNALNLSALGVLFIFLTFIGCITSANWGALAIIAGLIALLNLIPAFALSAALWQKHTEKKADECPKPVQKVLDLKEKYGDKRFYQGLVGIVVLLCALAFMGAGAGACITLGDNSLCLTLGFFWGEVRALELIE